MIKTFGDIDERVYEQLKRCQDDDAPAVLCADSHVGYSQPIGGAVAYRDKVSPSGVGYDIACGNKAVQTPLKADDLSIGEIMDRIWDEISFGVGGENKYMEGDKVLDQIKHAPFEPQRLLYDLACKQLGTVGSGNHYVDLFKDEEGYLWIGVHFGSRGFGHKTATGFLAMAQGKHFTEQPKGQPMDAPPVLFDTDSYLGQAYIDAMKMAGRYAYAGRNWVVNRVLEILDTEASRSVHSHHNFAWKEWHGESYDRYEYWVVRKGCTPAFPGQTGFVGSSMGGTSVILEGIDGQEAVESLYSTVHGAGRTMTRTEAAGKSKWVRWYSCNDRDCDYETREQKPCPKHPEGKLLKAGKRPIIVKPGKVDWPAVRQEIKHQGIELRGGGADEAPKAYKELPEVLDAHKDSIKILHTLTPVGVAMAGRDESGGGQ